MLPQNAARLLRKLILAYGRRMNSERMLETSRKRAALAATRAARSSPAYQTLLREQGLNPASLGPNVDITTLPVLTKTNTFERFSLNELARQVRPTDIADVLTSSGRGGPSFGFRLTGRKQHEGSWFDIDLGLQDVFGVDQKPTLLVNCLPMGVAFSSRAVTVSNVSVREDMACAILRDVGRLFSQTILCTDPVFIRKLLDEADRVGVDWSALNTSVIMGEEVLVETQRDYIAARMGMDLDGDPNRLIGSSFGIGELGLNLLFETRETITMRRLMQARRAGEHQKSLAPKDDALPSIFCYNPLRCHIEVLNADATGYGELCFTMLDAQAVIPLPRYATGDLGKLISKEETAATLGEGRAAPWLPVVALRGRIKDRPPGVPSVEQIKELIYVDHEVADQLSGAFRITAKDGGGVQLTLQTSGQARDSLNLRFHQLLEEQGIRIASLELLSPDLFPWRPSLDYERKFSYVSPNS